MGITKSLKTRRRGGDKWPVGKNSCIIGYIFAFLTTVNRTYQRTLLTQKPPPQVMVIWEPKLDLILFYPFAGCVYTLCIIYYIFSTLYILYIIHYTYYYTICILYIIHSVHYKFSTLYILYIIHSLHYTFSTLYFLCMMHFLH